MSPFAPALPVFPSLGFVPVVTDDPSSDTKGTATPMSTTTEDEPRQFTIDELFAETHVPSRTIRFYQSKGVLMPPKVKGRVAWYGDEHVERLRLIAQLQDRGLRIEAIRDLVGRIDKGEVDVADWLGLESQLKAPWANDQPKTCTEEELFELAGTRRAGLIADLVRNKLVERQGDVYLVRSPSILKIAVTLNQAGVDLETAAGAHEILRRHMAKATQDLVQYFFKHATEDRAGGLGNADYAETFRELRPVGLEAVRLVFGQEMERVLRELVDSGKTTKLPAGKKPGKR